MKISLSKVLQPGDIKDVEAARDKIESLLKLSENIISKIPNEYEKAKGWLESMKSAMGMHPHATSNITMYTTIDRLKTLVVVASTSSAKKNRQPVNLRVKIKDRI